MSELPGGKAEKVVIDDPPPILGSWRKVYAIVLGMLVLDIALFYFFMRMFS